MFLGNCKLKQQWYIYSNGKNPTHWYSQVLVRIWMEQQELFPLLVEKATLDGSLELLTKLKYSHCMIQKLYPWYLLKWVENISLHKSCTSVSKSFLHNYQNLEATKIFFHRLMERQTVLYPYNELLLSDLRNKNKNILSSSIKHAGTLNAHC